MTIRTQMKILLYPFLCTFLINSPAWSMERLDASGDAQLTTAFFSAATGGDLTQLQKLLENSKVDVTTKDANGNTALHMLVRRPEQHIADYIKLLINHKAGVNAQNDASETPLHLAIPHGRRYPVDQLLALGADPNQPSGIEGSLPLCIAFKYHFATYKPRTFEGHVMDVADDVTKALLEAGARVDNTELHDLDCQTHPHVLRYVYVPLIWAIEKNDITTVKRYLNQGVSRCLDFEELPNMGRPIGDRHNAKYPLNVATNCQNPSPEMVRFLIDAGCLGNVGYNLVHNAFTYGHLEMARLLLSHIPHTRIIKQWNKVALPVLACLNRLPQQLPVKACTLICLYSVRSACIAEQAENCRTLFKNEHFEFEGLGSSEAQRNNAYEREYTHILDNVPAWQEQIDLAIKNKPKALP